jgi:2-keto-3-deoxy-L-rhamnonate aldolase RhmA
MAQHLAQQDARCAVVAMIEDAEAIGAIEEIVAVEGLDAIFIGRADLAVSMGGNLRGSDLEAAVNRVLAAAAAVGLPVMILAANPVELAHLRARGATSFLTGSDQGFLLASAAQARASFLPRPGS